MFPSVLLVRPNSRGFFFLVFVPGGANCFFLFLHLLYFSDGIYGIRRQKTGREETRRKERGKDTLTLSYLNVNL